MSEKTTSYEQMMFADYPDMKFCEAQSVNFTISPQALSKALAEEGIIQVKNGQNTYTKRYGGNVRRRVMCIKKSEVKNIYGE